jgi:hypothetical protein
MSGLLLAIFLISTIAVIGFALSSRRSTAAKATIVAGTLAFSLFAYLLATTSTISPFSRSSGVSFGADDHLNMSIVIALVGAIGGVFGSYLFNLGGGSFNVRGLLRPLSACPLVIIPTIKLVESASDRSALAYILLFALSYQNGFFWERLLKREQ